MKNYTITVNGNVYEVTVEEGFTGKAAAPKAAAPVQAPKAAPAPAAALPGSSPGSCGSSRWCSRKRCSDAPMPGKILGVKASAGQAVKKGQVIVILEAMKMENEIVAPQDGTVATINVAVGDSVEPGATLATLN